MSVPTGTVTFLLSDVVSSTELWQDFPEAMPDALRDHEQIVRAVLASSGGYEFGTAGDSFAVAFATAADAVQAATDVQRALEAHEWGAVRIQIRIGLHSGQAEERDGRYFGPVVNRAARIESLAGPGHILISEAAHALVRGQLGDDVTFRDLGDQELKSFDRPERVFRVVAPGLVTTEHGTPRRLSDTLPHPPTSFVGRQDTVEAVADAIAPGSLVTITGLGGLGKTRLSIEAARRAASSFPDGIWWVDLSPLADGESIALHTAAALGVTVQGAMSPEASLADALRRQDALVVFDNCEHVIRDAAALIADLRDGCPGLGLLATSREPLDLAGEQNWPLATMPTGTDAVALLIERARAHDVGFDPDRWPSSELTDLCARLDGMPLAIEMAAARLRALSPSEIIDRLEDRFRLLRSRDRQVAARHQTLLAALDWSYELLDDDERLLLDRLSIFAGTFDVRAVEQVCADARLDEFDVLDLLTSLLEKSLVSQVNGTGTSRYRLLETVRAYCSGHLSTEDASALRASLVSFAVGVAQHNEAKWLGDTREDFDDAFEAFGAEWDNFRAAVRWAIELEDSAACNVIFRALWIFAFETFRTEIGDWARAAAVLEPPAMTAIGVAAVASNERADAISLLEGALADVDESEPNHEACLLYGVLHGMDIARGGEQVRHLAERCVFHAPAMSTSRVASHRANLAMIMVEADPDEAAEHARFANDYLDRSQNPWRASCVSPLAMYEAKRGRPEIGHQLCMRGVEMTTDAGLAWSLMSALASRARIALRYSVGEPRADLVEAIEVGRSSRAWYGVWLAMAESVVWLHRHYPPDLSATVAGYMSKRGIWYRPVPDGERTKAETERDLDPRSGQTAGAAMRRDELIDYLLHELAS